jgi:hypothetical protein
MTAPGAAGGSRSGASVDAGIGAGISKRRLRAMRLGKPAGTGPTSAAGKARSAQNARKHGLNVPVMYDPDVSADVAFMAEEIAPGCQDPELIGRARLIAEAQVDLIRVARARRDIISAAMADPNCGPITGLTGRMAIGARLSRGCAANSSPPPCGEGSGVGIEPGSTAFPTWPAPPPHPSPSRNRVYAGFGHSTKRSKSATGDFDWGEGVVVARQRLNLAPMGRMAMPGESGGPGADELVAVLSDMSARLAKLDRYERIALSRRKGAIRAFDAARRKAARWRRPARV